MFSGSGATAADAELEDQERARFAPLLRTLKESYSDGTENEFKVEKSTSPNANVLRAQAIAQSSRIATFMTFHEPTTYPYTTVQASEGVVEDVSSEDVNVRIIDKTEPARPESFTQLSFDQIDDEDRDLVRPGAVFYWVIGYELRPSGKKTTSFIRFRRSPMWTKSNIKDVERKANELFQRFQNSQPTGS